MSEDSAGATRGQDGYFGVLVLVESAIGQLPGDSVVPLLGPFTGARRDAPPGDAEALVAGRIKDGQAAEALRLRERQGQRLRMVY